MKLCRRRSEECATSRVDLNAPRGFPWRIRAVLAVVVGLLPVTRLAGGFHSAPEPVMRQTASVQAAAGDRSELVPSAQRADGACSTWAQAPAPDPVVTYSAASLAYDGATGQIVLFGGILNTGSVPQNETFIWDGSSWSEANPADSPPGRNSAMMAYDPATSQLVLFGGQGGGYTLDDTWLWTGDNWVEQFPQTSPSPRSVAAMAYDPSISEIVLFGGSTISSPLGDTWVWTGTDWVELHPPVSPPARDAASIALSQDGRLVLFGGANNYGYLGDTWTWNGTDWQRQHPAVSPAPRQGASAAYDSQNGQLLLFGGAREGGGGYDDTWVWTGSTWSLQHPAAIAPGSGDAMAYDASSNQVMLSGCTCPPPTEETP
jgi:hypothetical protein